MVAGLNMSVAHSITAPKLGDRCKNIFGSALKGKALTILAHKLARAVYDMLKTAFDIAMFLRT